MSLSATGWVYVELRTGRQRVVTSVDRGGVRCLDPRISREPLS